MPELKPYYEQEPFLRDDKRWYAFVSGIGAGKTAAGIIRVIANVERWNPGELGAIIAPTGTNIRDIILPEMRDLGLLDYWEYRGKSSEEPGLHAPNGARVILEGADNRRKIERLRGLNLSWWWMDEAAIIPERAYDILTGRLRAGQYRNGFVTTTPKGRNWVYDRFVGDVEGERTPYGEATVFEGGDVTSLLEVPSYANPHTPDDFKESVGEDYEGSFYRQEVLGEFTSFDGLVYPWFREDDNVIEDAPDRFDEIIYGLDWGFSNPTVILAIGIRDGTPVVLEEVYEPRLTVDDTERELAALQDLWAQGTIYCDPAEPASIEKLRRAGHDATEADNDVMPGIQHIAGLQDELHVVGDCQNVVNEFKSYQYRDGGDSDKPKKQHDHSMDALRYALFTHMNDPGVAMTTVSFGDDTDTDGVGLPGLGNRR